MLDYSVKDTNTLEGNAFTLTNLFDILKSEDAASSNSLSDNMLDKKVLSKFNENSGVKILLADDRIEVYRSDKHTVSLVLDKDISSQVNIRQDNASTGFVLNGGSTARINIRQTQ